MDRIGANFYYCLESIEKQLGARPVAMQLPIGSESDFKGVVDLVKMKAIVWNDESLGASFDEVEIPDDLQDKAAEYREKMIEAAVEMDDDAMEAYLEGEEPDEETLKKLIRKGTLNFEFVPVLLGTAFKNKGVQPLLDAVVDFMPAPTDVEAIKGETKDGEETQRISSDDEPFSALAFKIATDPYVGTLTFARIYSGVLKSGDQIINSVKGKKERVSRMVLMHANSREEIPEARAGDIVALVGMKDTTTGETLCDPENPVILEKMDFPEPVIKIAVEPKSKGDQEKMANALYKLGQEDPSFRYSRDEQSGQTVIEGMGELHLDIIVDRMRREFNVECNVGAPQVAYREAITKKANIDYTHKKQSGGSGQYARIVVDFEPWTPAEDDESSEGFQFVSEIKGGTVPKEYIPGVVKGIESETTRGPLAGFPVLGFKATLLDGAYHDVDSSVMAFEIAARAAFREGMVKAKARLSEPIMKVDVTTPEEHMGDVIGDINSRRGQVLEMSDRGNVKQVSALVPLSEMFQYVSTLRSISKGRAQYQMQLHSYDFVPPNLEREIIDSVKSVAA